ncbi:MULTISPECIES: DMT family transporter [Photobacterium]|uniref:DMT family transporter n=1 Tax=Photobacterium alginatilyticum TaxID=1775171 RepID=A0ABW9YJ23_9GAMM|nr:MULTISPECIES: DMT family transporter [Photobacterium]NBI53223.1 DMT family transporter [Photobacterium alginatilyticum]
MFELALTIGIGLLGGIAVGTQAPIAGAMSQRVGGAASSFIVHLGGLIASLILLLSRRGEDIAQWRELPWYMLGCGAFGLVLYLSISHTIPKLGAVSAITLIIVGQLLAGVVIDYLGAFGTIARGLEMYRMLGIALLFAGAYLVIR